MFVKIEGWDYSITKHGNSGIRIWHHVTPDDGGYGTEVDFTISDDYFMSHTVEDLYREICRRHLSPSMYIDRQSEIACLKLHLKGLNVTFETPSKIEEEKKTTKKAVPGPDNGYRIDLEDGGYILSFYHDGNGNEVEKEKAKAVISTVFDSDGRRIQEVYGRLGGEKQKTDEELGIFKYDNGIKAKHPSLKGKLIKGKKSGFSLQKGYDVDLVFCIDNSENMKNHLDRVKEWIPEIITRYTNSSPLSIYGIGNYRARLIIFNSYELQKDDTILVTDFIDLKNAKEFFLKTLNGIEIQPGTTENVCGLEALTYAAHSKWSENYKKRRYIWVFSNSNTNQIGDDNVRIYYRKGIPKSTEEFINRWNYMDKNYTILFMTPYEKHWDTAIDNLQGICYPSVAGEGVKEDDSTYQELFGEVALGFD
ncbi:MAG: VWA domain-containing protein [Ruminococcaceae bacterium]|nr:VWA domain-containing protein [Oscillospiraceae bacterium]